MNRRNPFRTMEVVREATLLFAASCAEGYASLVNPCNCGKPGCPSCSFGTAYHSRGGDDFLADLIRLNVEYMAGLARLSASYTTWATRALDRAYRGFGASGYAEECSEEVHTVGKLKQKAVAAVKLVNGPQKARLAIKGPKGKLKLCQVDDPDEEVEVEYSYELEGGKAELGPGESVRVIFTVELGKGLEANKRYYGVVRIQLGEQTQRLGLVIDVVS